MLYLPQLTSSIMAKKIRKLIVNGINIGVTAQHELDYISLTDMAKGFSSVKSIENWLRTKSTIEFLGAWEEIFNSNFNSPVFEGIKNKEYDKNFTLSVKQWIKATNAIGLVAKAGRYGGTYAHKDIAFEFAMWLSPYFKLYLIKDWERLKNEETKKQKGVEWNYSRFLSKVNYRIHTNAVKTLIPLDLPKFKIGFLFASEADLLNVALFGITAKEWRKTNPNKEGNMRDYATIEQLNVLANLEAYNAVLINEGVKQLERLHKMREVAVTQLKIMLESPALKRLKK